MSGEQFSEKDRSFIEDAIESTNVPYGENIIIKRFDGFVNTGNPAGGVQPVLKFKRIPATAIIAPIVQQDVVYSGGVYQIGDIKITLKEQLNFMDTTTQTGGKSEGDRVIYRGHEYRIVGKSDDNILVGTSKIFIYTLRKIGNA